MPEQSQVMMYMCGTACVERSYQSTEYKTVRWLIGVDGRPRFTICSHIAREASCFNTRINRNKTAIVCKYG